MEHNLVGVALAGRYKLVKLVGQGGMGSVYQAADLQMNHRVVAVKVLAPHLVSDDKQIARFEQEARAANLLRHPNTISVLDFGRSADNHIYMVMEFLTGETLTAILRRGRIEPMRALYMMRQICKSLAEAHSHGIVHRDLKPDNIFICEIYGEKDFIKVIDFGIAKFLMSTGQELTQVGKMFGTPRYISPEQAQGLPLTASSDLYAVGILLFEMLAGRAPFVAEDPIAVAIKHVQEKPPSFAEVAPDLDVSEELDHLVFKLLAKTPAERYASADEVVRAIDEVMHALGGLRHGGHFTPVAAVTPPKPRPLPSQRAPSATQQPAQVAPRPRASSQQPAQPKVFQHVERTLTLDAKKSDRDPRIDRDPRKDLDPREERTLAIDISNLPPEDDDEAPVQRTQKDLDAAPTRHRTLLYAALATGLVLLVVAVVVALTSESSEPSPPPPVAQIQAAPQEPEHLYQPSIAPPHTLVPPPPSAEAPPPKAQRVTLASQPSGAIVLKKGEDVGRTPYEIVVKPGDADRVLTLRQEGYEDRIVDVITDTVLRKGLTQLPLVEMQVKAPLANAAPQPPETPPPQHGAVASQAVTHQAAPPPPRVHPKKPKERDWE